MATNWSTATTIPGSAAPTVDAAWETVRHGAPARMRPADL